MREVGGAFPLLAETRRERGGGGGRSSGRPEARMGRLPVSESPAAPLSLESGPWKRRARGTQPQPLNTVTGWPGAMCLGRCL